MLSVGTIEIVMRNLARARAYSNSLNLNASFFYSLVYSPTIVSRPLEIVYIILKYIKIAWLLINLCICLDPWGQNSVTFMFTCTSIVINMHKRFLFFFLIFYLYTKWPQTEMKAKYSDGLTIVPIVP